VFWLVHSQYLSSWKPLYLFKHNSSTAVQNYRIKHSFLLFAHRLVRFEILMMMMMIQVVFWVVTPCILPHHYTVSQPRRLWLACRLSFPIVQLKIYSLSVFPLKPPNKIFMQDIGNWSSIHSCLLYRKTLFLSSLLSYLGAWTYKEEEPHHKPLHMKYVYIIVSLINSTLSTFDLILLCLK
jgi:hypothetical protein